MRELIENLRAERRQLHDELAADPRHQKIKAIDELLALYAGNEHADAPVVNQAQTIRDSPSRVPTASTASRLTKAEQIKRMISEYLGSKGNAHRSEILKSLQTAGLMADGGDQMGALAAYLSKWRDDFASDGRGNFSLIRPVRGIPTDLPRN